MAIRLNGTTQAINLGTNLSILNGAAAASVMSWIRPRIPQATRGIVSIAISPPPTPSSISRVALEIGGVSMSILAIVRNADIDPGSSLSSAAVLTAGEWQHIGFSYDCVTKGMFIYRNGVLVASGTATNATGTAFAATNSKNGALGSGDTAADLFFAGDIEDTRIYPFLFGPSLWETLFATRGKDAISIRNANQTISSNRWQMDELGDDQTVVMVPDIMPGVRINGTPVGAPTYIAGISEVPKRKYGRSAGMF